MRPLSRAGTVIVTTFAAAAGTKAGMELVLAKNSNDLIKKEIKDSTLEVEVDDEINSPSDI